jgi:hypothetical protein
VRINTNNVRCDKPASLGVTMGNRRSFVPTDQQRETARQHVVFELRMLREVARLHDDARRRMAGDAASMCLVSALRDSALLHTRNLHDFFLVPPTRDDIVASDFLDPAHVGWRADSLLASVAEGIDDINKFRSHLTYTRTERTRTWPLDVFMNEIDAAVSDFLLHMTEAEREAWRQMIDSPDWRPVRQQSGFLSPRPARSR